jgi:hypothetical protein
MRQSQEPDGCDGQRCEKGGNAFYQGSKWHFRTGIRTASRNVHDHCSADDFMDDVEMYFTLVVEGRYVGIVACKPLMSRPHPKVVQDCIRRDRSLAQIQRVCC